MDDSRLANVKSQKDVLSSSSSSSGAESSSERSELQNVKQRAASERV